MRSFDEENFEEALANVWRLASPSAVCFVPLLGQTSFVLMAAIGSVGSTGHLGRSQLREYYQRGMF